MLQNLLLVEIKDWGIAEDEDFASDFLGQCFA